MWWVRESCTVRPSVNFQYLIDCPEAVPTIGAWYFDEWGYLREGSTLDDSVDRVREYLNRDRIPFILVGWIEKDICAVAQLKYREMEDLFPEKEHWLGGVYVPEPHRGRGFGSRIANKIVELAPAHGVSTLYLQTERLDGGIYAKLGWRPVERVDNRGLEVLVMEKHL